jgi:hypothetical protein
MSLTGDSTMDAAVQFIVIMLVAWVSDVLL